MSEVSNALRGLANVLETIEAGRCGETMFDITSVTPLSRNILDSNTVGTTLEVRVPFIDSDAYDELSGLSVKDVRLTEDGSLRAKFLVVSPRGERNVTETEPTDSPAEDGDGATSEVETVGETSGSDADRSEPESDACDPESTTDGGPEVTAYRNPDKLRKVYEAHDTFIEMTEALGVDVTPQTVRRYMIKYGIHEPASNTGSPIAEILHDADPDTVSKSGDGRTPKRTELTDESAVGSPTERTASAAPVSTDGRGGIRDGYLEPEPRAQRPTEPEGSSARDAAEEPKTNSDNASTATEETESGRAERTLTPADDDEGAELARERDHASVTDAAEIDVDLPDHLTLDDIKRTAQSAQTLYEAQRQLDLDREAARRLLQELDLLELVHGRIATRDLTDRTIEDINRRLRSTASSDPEET